jgi:hypothetical protein
MSETPLTPPSPDPAEPELARVLARIANEDARALLRELWQEATWHPIARRRLIETWDGSLDHVLSDREKAFLSLDWLEETLGDTARLRSLAAKAAQVFPAPLSPTQTVDDVLAELARDARRARKRSITEALFTRLGASPELRRAYREMICSPWYLALSNRDQHLADLALIEHMEGSTPDLEELRQAIIRNYPPPSASSADRRRS